MSATNRPASVDLAPLIDVVFILLIFFVVSTTFARDRGVDVKRPRASQASPTSEAAVRVQLTSAGKCFLEGEPTDLSGLTAALRGRAGGGAPLAVLIVPDARADAQSLVDVMDATLTAGVTDIAVATGEGERP